MKKELSRCPDCGLTPEFYFRDYSFGACSGALKCPSEHYRVQHSYWAGGKSKAKLKLIEKWMQLVEQRRGEVKNG